MKFIKQGEHTQNQTLRNMRRGYALFSLLFIFFAGGYSWLAWVDARRDVSIELTSLAELSGNSLDSYFLHYQRAYRSLSEDIEKAGGVKNLHAVHKLLKQFVFENPDLEVANLIALDGQLVATSNAAPGRPLPSQANEESFKVGRAFLQQGSDFDVGHTFYGPLLKGWIVPLRYAMRDEFGDLRYILAAALPLDRQQRFWSDLRLPSRTVFGLIRDDDYLVSRYPDYAKLDMETVYGSPRTGILVKHLHVNPHLVRGYVEGVNSVERSYHMFGYRRLKNSPLTLFVTAPVENLYENWWLRVRSVYLLMLVVGAGMFWVYRRMRLSQLAVEKEQEFQQGKLLESEQRLSRVVSEAPLPMMIHAENGEVLEINKAWSEATGYSHEEIPDIASWVRHAYEENTRVIQDPKSVKELIDRVYGIGHRVDQGERTIRCKDGSTRVWHFSAAPVGRLPDGRRYVVSMAQDISESKAAQQQIEFMAYHDALTGLPNRLLAKNLLEQAILEALRDGSKVALLFVDLDKFKTINDSLGHLVGDALLRAVAGRLRSCLRDVDTLSRQGGDEFLIVLKDVMDSDSITVVTDKLLSQLAEPVTISQHELSISLSIGIAVYPDDGKDFDTLLKKSDIAMYQAKDSGRNTYRFHTEQMNVNATEHLRLRNGMKRALDQGEFQLYYQPQISTASGAVIGVEALLRWQHPELGMVAPGRFISIAEDSGMIVPISEWVIREACRQAVAWQKAGLPRLLMAVNLSAVHFKRGDVTQSVLQALAETGLDPVFLELELTESILIKDTEKVLGIVRQLKSIGLKLAIDDFGTGYSSLSYLKQFNVDKLKIDQSFVRDMADDPNDAAIVRAIIQMAKSLNLVTIAEGVEDDRQLALLRLQQCDEVQGYLFAKPMPADALGDFLRQRSI